MKTTCPKCNSAYEIADEKVEGRTFKVRCHVCEHMVVIQGPPAVRIPRPPLPEADASGESEDLDNN